MAIDDKYIQAIESLEYPEYSHAGDEGNGIDLGLTDLSLSEKESLDDGLKYIVSETLENIGKYSYSQDPHLIRLISENDGVQPENVLITSGCDGALRVISRLLISEKTSVCIPLPSFGRYEYHAKVNMGKITYIYPSRFPFDIDLNKILHTEKSLGDFDVTFLANPNNPTGIYKNESEIKGFLNKTRGYLVLDESLDNPDVRSLTGLILSHDNLIVARSFSKVHGLAGARIGYVLANKELIKVLAKLVSPFEVSPISIALASAVIIDKRYYFSSVRQIRAAHRALKKIKNPDISTTPSSSSTLLVRYARRRNLHQLLLENGIKTVDCRDFRGFENKNCIRISIKDLKSIEYLIKILNKL